MSCPPEAAELVSASSKDQTYPASPLKGADFTPMPAKSLPLIALTLGDPAGIGPEIIAKTLRDPRLPKGFRFGSPGRARKHQIEPLHPRLRPHRPPCLGRSDARLPRRPLRRHGHRPGTKGNARPDRARLYRPDRISRPALRPARSGGRHGPHRPQAHGRALHQPLRSARRAAHA